MTPVATLDSVGGHYLDVAIVAGLPIEKEELYPRLTVTGLPRVGTVTVGFSVETSPGGDRNEPTWDPWWIVLRDYSPTRGVGPSAARTIRDLCEPVIREWLTSDEYRASRQRAAAACIVRQLQERGRSRQSARAAIEWAAPHLTRGAVRYLWTALAALEMFDDAIARAQEVS